MNEALMLITAILSATQNLQQLASILQDVQSTGRKISPEEWAALDQQTVDARQALVDAIALREKTNAALDSITGVKTPPTRSA